MVRRAVKSIIYGIGWILTAPLWLPETAAKSIWGRDVWLAGQSQALSLLPGTIGILIRNAYYRMVLNSCPYHVCFQFGCLLSYSQVNIGSNVYLGVRSQLGLVDIGEDTIISDDVHLLSGSHQHNAQGFTQNFQAQPEHKQRIYIGKNCWIGARAVVMADVGDNCLIGAGAVVARPIPANCVAVGVPARVVRVLRENEPANPVSAVSEQACPTVQS